MDDEYGSCEWIEGGLAFNRRSLHSCLIVHHHTGLPFVADYNGGEIPFDTLLAAREAIRAANRSGTGHPECRGCAHLTKRAWPRPRYPIEIVGIAHYSYCNIKCSYCFLQTQDPASFAAGYKPYSLLPVVRRLIDDGHLAPHAIIDWGGGEPTSYPEFDERLEALLAHGTFHYVHTNGTRFPASLRRAAHPERVHVICSVDAGLPATYTRIKQKDYLARVWRCLGEYAAAGALVTLKYIVLDENRGAADLDAFAARAAALRPHSVIVDFDYDVPDPGPAVVGAMGRLKSLGLGAGVPARFGFTGSNFAPEYGITARAEEAFRGEPFRRGRPDGTPPPSEVTRRRSGLARLVRWAARPWREYPARTGVAWLEHDLPMEWPAGAPYRATVRVRNEGERPWRATHPDGRCVELAVLIGGAIRTAVRVPHDVHPGQEVAFALDLTFPDAGGSFWQVKLALIEQGVGWLERRGATALVTPVRTRSAWAAPPRTERTATPNRRAEETPDAAPQARPDQPGGVGRRVWHLPVATDPRGAGDRDAA